MIHGTGRGRIQVILSCSSSPIYGGKTLLATFTDIPQVELLQWLARGTLKQNLLRGIRLWVWLCFLYGDSSDRWSFQDGFTLVDWRNSFFSSTHPKGETIPELHDPKCPCAKTTAAWLFDPTTGLSEREWKRSLLAHDRIDNLDELLQKRLFGVTRRSLQQDLQILAELSWLENRGQKYHRVVEFPPRPITTTPQNQEFNFLNQEDLVQIAQNLSKEICGVQRVFFKLDYVVTEIDQVDTWQDELRKLWSQTPVPPISLTYHSARLGNTVECLVYPVCVYYVQRAVYLCAFGQSPDRKTDWYNFRLDRILKITPKEWTNPLIPPALQRRYQNRNLPNPEEIEFQMSRALGFDFYMESRLMLLRFDRKYHDSYIRSTNRHETFNLINYGKAERLIQNSGISREDREILLNALGKRCREDAYYTLQYRDQDFNVIMRLRAWRPKVEIFLPYDLRQKIASEINREFLLYNET